MKTLLFAVLLLFASGQDGCESIQQSEASKDARRDELQPTPTPTPFNMRDIHPPSLPAQDNERTSAVRFSGRFLSLSRRFKLFDGGNYA